MNIFVLHVLASKAAEMHCDKHVGKMLIEACQILYTVIYLTGLDSSGFGLQIYRPTHKKHPCTLWALACRFHAKWVLELGLALGQRFQSLYKPAKMHKSLAHLEQMQKQNIFDALPISTSAELWSVQLRTLGFEEHVVESCLSRIASKNPPHGCAFGVTCVNPPADLVDTIFVKTEDGQVDLVETYQRFMVFKAKREMVFLWASDSIPPSGFGKVFTTTLANEQLLTKDDVRKRKYHELE